jgi:hypothetical protein
MRKHNVTVLGSRQWTGVGGQLHASAALLLGLSPRYPLYGELSGSQCRSGCSGVENMSCPYKKLNPSLPSHSPISTPTEIPQIRRATHSVRILCNALFIIDNFSMI